MPDGRPETLKIFPRISGPSRTMQENLPELKNFPVVFGLNHIGFTYGQGSNSFFTLGKNKEPGLEL